MQYRRIAAARPAKPASPPARAERLLAAWRSDARPSREELAEITALLTTSVLLHRRGWRAVVRHDAAAAVAAGIDLFMSGRLVGPASDVVFSALVLHAAEGNVAAELVLRNARDRRRRDDLQVT